MASASFGLLLPGDSQPLPKYSWTGTSVETITPGRKELVVTFVKALVLDLTKVLWNRLT